MRWEKVNGRNCRKHFWNKLAGKNISMNTENIKGCSIFMYENEYQVLDRTKNKQNAIIEEENRA